MRIVKNRYTLPAAILLANILVFVLIASFGRMLYDDNDDVMMCLIANGAYSGTPDPHLVFQNALWGYFLTLLYSIIPKTEWYAVCLTILHIVSMTIIIYEVLTRGGRRIGAQKLVFVMLLYLLWTSTLISLQFTTTAAIATVAGCLFMLRDGKLLPTAGGMLILVASFVRFESAAMTGLLLGPYIMYRHGWTYWKYIKYALLLVAVFAGRAADSSYYRSNQWKYYMDYNKERAAINDSPNAMRVSGEALARNHIDSIDYEALRSFFPDPGVVTLPVISDLANEASSTPLRIKAANLMQLRQYRASILLLLLLTILLTAGAEKRSRRIMICATFVLAMGLTAFVSLERHIKPRVFWSAFTAATCVFACQPVKEDKRITIPLLIVLFAMCAKSAKTDVQRYMWNARAIRIYHEEQLPLLRHLPDGATVACWSLVHIEALPPFGIKEHLPVNIYPSSWLSNIPLREGYGDSNTSLLKEDVFIFTNTDDLEVKSIRHGLKRHYGIETLSAVLYRNKSYAIVKLEPLYKTNKRTLIIN